MDRLCIEKSKFHRKLSSLFPDKSDSLFVRPKTPSKIGTYHRLSVAQIGSWAPYSRRFSSHVIVNVSVNHFGFVRTHWVGDIFVRYRRCSRVSFRERTNGHNSYVPLPRSREPFFFALPVRGTTGWALYLVSRTPQVELF